MVSNEEDTNIRRTSSSYVVSRFMQTIKSNKRVEDAFATPSRSENNRLDRCCISPSQLLSLTPKKKPCHRPSLICPVPRISNEHPTNSESMNHVVAADPEVGR